MITADDYRRLVVALGSLGADDIRWATEDCKRPDTSEEMAHEIIFVICNSGMKNTVARGIYRRVISALEIDASASTAFGHKGKTGAIDQIWRRRDEYYANLLGIHDDAKLLEWCRSLPWIGGITCYHLAKNFGADVAKPDVHLQRLADREGVTAQQLCERLAAELSTCVRAVDTILWRACANGLIHSPTGEIRIVNG